MSEERKIRKAKPMRPWPSDTAYDLAKIDLVLQSAPEIAPCGDCGWPKVKGNRCTYCPRMTNPEVR